MDLAPNYLLLFPVKSLCYAIKERAVGSIFLYIKRLQNSNIRKVT